MDIKLKVDYTKKLDAESELLIMSPVECSEKRSIPWGKLELSINTSSLLGTFKRGDEYLVQFTKLDA